MLVIDKQNPVSPQKITLTSTLPTTINHNQYIKAATTNNTRKAYKQDIKHFISWGGKLPTTTETIIQYLNFHAKLLNPRTLERRLTGLSQWHITQSLPDPTKTLLVKKTLKGIKNIHGKPKKKAPALLIEKLITIVEKLSTKSKLIDIRDNAILQLNFFGAFRRSELAALNYEDITFHEGEGMRIQVTRSKTDQEGEGQIVSIPIFGTQENPTPALCPVTALENWLAASKIKNGPLFRSLSKNGKISENPLHPYNINCIIKKIANTYLNDGLIYSSHSLRSGFATSAAITNVPLHEIMKQARWVKPETALGYCQAAKDFQENAALKIMQSLKKS